MVATHSTGQAMFVHSINEDLENGFGTVIVAGTDPRNQPRFPICKAVYDKLEAYEAWAQSREERG